MAHRMTTWIILLGILLPLAPLLQIAEQRVSGRAARRRQEPTPQQPRD
jgi:hypothetical protein